MSDWAETKLPCPDQTSCGSSDAAAVNTDGWTHCFSCGKRWPPGDHEDTPRKGTSKVAKDLVYNGSVEALTKRKISEQTCAKFGYKRGEMDGEVAQFAPYHDAKGNLIATKVRFKEKSFTTTGDFKNVALFGQRLWSGGKRLVITEGEIDALSYAEVTNCSWPVVSVPGGAPSAKAAILKNLEFIESFEEVVLWFDDDEPGRKAANECAVLLTPGKAKLAFAPGTHKDANDMLVAGDVLEMKRVVYNAKPFRPDGVINANELWEVVSTPLEMGTPYPWAGLNASLFGLRPREIVTLTAGSGIGKSTICAEIAYHMLKAHGQKVGYVALEEGCDRTALRFMSLAANKTLHLPGSNLTEAERRAAFDATCGTGNLMLYDHFGSLDSDNLLAKMAYMVKGMGVRWLFLDHLSIVVSGIDPDEDERRALDRTMTRLRSFTEETGAGLILVSHLKRPRHKGHEDGAKTSLAQLRGSAAIAQLSDIVIGAERNQQGKTEERNTMVMRVLKNRYAGITGPCCALEYNSVTGRLSEMDGFDPDDIDDDDDEPDY